VSRRRIAILALGLTVAITATTATIAGTAGANTTAQSARAQKTSYLEVLDDVMCVVCHEPLGVAQSPEAFQERDYIRQLIAQGKRRTEIEDDLVQQYGPAVLARPPAHGVNLLVYIIPPVVLVLGIAIIAVFIPRWRRRGRDAASEEPAHTIAELDAADAQRLNEDLERIT
jgi:cytochrome c-type biogenesis protein CcmH